MAGKRSTPSEPKEKEARVDFLELMSRLSTDTFTRMISVSGMGAHESRELIAAFKELKS